MAKKVQLKGFFVIVGSYGSGKTEISINLCINRRAAGLDVKIADLDIVNPYFRTREAAALLSDLGIQTVFPADQYLHSELPALNPQVAGLIQNTSQFVLLDCGGSDVGSLILASFASYFQKCDFHMLQVINPYRPSSDTVEKCLEQKMKIEKSSKLKINGFVSNANLVDKTDLQIIYNGYDLVKKVSESAGLPVAFLAADRRNISGINPDYFDCPLLPMDRYLGMPWHIS